MGKTQLFTNAILFLPDTVIYNGNILVRDGKIVQITEGQYDCGCFDFDEIVDVNGNFITPGFIDIHCHGANGYSVMNAAEDESSLEQLCKFYASTGVTSFLGTTLTDDFSRIKSSVANIGKYIKNNVTNGAQLLGIHLEGPYINSSRCGAQDKDNIRNINVNEIEELICLSSNKIKIVTFAPELNGANEMIKFLIKRNIVASVGHSEATYDIVKNAVSQGISQITHVFNGMPQIHHREPGIAGAFLMQDGLSGELICDGIHLHRDIIAYIFKNKPINDIILITDSMQPTGCSDGEYQLGNVTVVKMGCNIKLKDKDVLAGSCLTMDKAVKNVMNFTGMPLEYILPSVTINPARQAGVLNMKGTLECGKDADIVILNKNYEVMATFVKGINVYEKGNL